MVNNDGESRTISPYAPNFWNHIERGIEPLVKSLTNKGYLPYSSCEGHSIFGRRFVSLAFANEESARKVADIIRLLKEDLIDLQIKSRGDYYHSPEYGDRDRKKEIGWLNSIYLRGYEEYYFLEISIGRNTPPKWGNFTTILKKLYFRDCITHQLIAFIDSERMPFYES